MTSKERTYICPLPFIGVHYSSGNGIGPCCLNTTISEAVTVEEYFKNPTLLKLRDDMLANRRNSICDKCYKWEDLNIFSQRSFWMNQYANNNFSVETSPHVFEVRISNMCNCKCRLCDETYSSSHAAELVKFNPLIGRSSVVRIAGPTEDFVLNEIKKYAKDLKIISFSGGEPLLQWQHWAILDHLIENNYDPELQYYSNATILTHKNQHIVDKWKHFSKIIYKVSLDAVDAAAGYWRHGQNFNTYFENIKLVSTMPNVQLQFVLTLAWPNVFNIEKAGLRMREIKPQYKICINMVYHRFFTLQLLPLDYKLKVKNYLQEVHDRNPTLIEGGVLRLIDYMFAEDKSDQMGNAIAYLKKVDEWRSEIFMDAFPEYEELAKRYGYTK